MFRSPFGVDRLASGVTIFNPQALPLFESARRRGTLHHFMARLFRRAWRLPVLDDFVDVRHRHNLPGGTTCPVTICTIKGSVNRSDDFDQHFYPLTDRLENRWVRIASMMLQDTALPPIELVRVDEIYFVVDGHHRISVARMLHYEAMDAVITAVYSAPDVHFG